MKIKIVFLLLLALTHKSFTQNSDFFNTIILDDIDRVYPIDSFEDSSYSVSFHFDLNRYRLEEPIMMEIRIYAKKGVVSFTNSANSFNNYKFNLYDLNNKIVGTSDNYALWENKNISIAQNAKARVVTLREGETYSYTIDLNDWFMLEDIGQYRLEGSFNPMPNVRRDFSIKANRAYFYVDKAQIIGNKNKKELIRDKLPINNRTPSTDPPYDIVNNTLRAMQNRDWKNYFKNMHMPSIINISTRYGNHIRESYTDIELEDFSDTGLSNTYNNIDLETFLITEFGDSVSIESMRRDFGNNFVSNLEEAFNNNTVRKLSLKFEILYRTALLEDKQKLFEEFKNYLISAYDKDLRASFVYEIRRKSLSGTLEEREYYTSLLSLLEGEYDPNITYTLLSYKILKTTVEDQYGLPTAIVEASLNQRFFNFNTGNLYEPKITRVFTLRKMGNYWYIVNYYDVLGR